MERKIVNIFSTWKNETTLRNIRKLYISGSISTNPFEIMDAQKRFYSKLYNRKPVDLNNEETKTCLESLNIERLKITLRECEGILSPFQIGKTSGNDGILVEFYKIFWPLIGKLMTDSFNEALSQKRNVFFAKTSCYYTH